MRMKSAFIVAAGFAAVLQVATAADLTGAVTLKGAPPAEKEITPLKEDATCGKLHAEMPRTRFYVVGAKGELADVVVMLKGIGGKSTGASAAPVVMDQKGCEYVPQILAVQTGQKIIVKNSDPLLHNIHTIPTVTGNAEANKAQMPGGADLSFSFDKPENFLKFKCDVHPWMFAWVTVVDHPYFAVTDKGGRCTIKDVPAGKYTVVALHRKAAPAGVEKEVEVKDGGATVDFNLEVPAAK
jgi:plastocyanin